MNLLTDPAPSPAVIAGFSVLAVAVAGVAVLAVQASSRNLGEAPAVTSRRVLRVAVGLVAWLVATAGLAASGLLGHFELLPPPLMPLVAIATVASTAFAFSSSGTVLARGLPLAALVGFQAFRVPLEIMLHQLSLDGVLPAQMTWDGMNHDVVSGLGAAAVALWASRATPPRFVLVLWNLVGVALLLVIVAVAVMSTPGPLRLFPNEPANRIVATFPFVWLPTVLVQAAWIGHLLMFRRLAMDRK